MRYDSFFCFNREDFEQVKKIADYLIKFWKLRIWLDAWNLIPGELWIPQVYEGLQMASTCAVFVGKNGQGPWQRREVENALINQTTNPNFRVIPVLLPDAPQKLMLPPFLNGYKWVDFRHEFRDEALRLLVCGKGRDRQIILRSENPEFNDIVVCETDEFFIEGKVIQLIRNYR